MKKALNIALLISFIVTIMVPLTGVHVHKMASVLFLLLSIVHTIVYRKKLGAKRWLLLALIVISFATGLFGIILDQFPIILILHRCISIAVVFFLAIHIFYSIRSFFSKRKKGPGQTDQDFLCKLWHQQQEKAEITMYDIAFLLFH